MVAASVFIMMMMFGTFMTFGIFFKPLVTEFNWTRTVTSGAVSLAWIVNGLLGIVMGGFTDRFGSRIVVTLCGILMALGYFLMSRISAVWQLYLFFGVIVGAGFSGSYVPLTSTAAKWFVKRRSLMTGIVMAGGGTGVLIAAPGSNWLISSYDWSLSYIILGGIVLITVVLFAQLLRHDPAQMGQLPYGENREGAGREGETRSFSLKEAASTGRFWLVFSMFLCLGFAVTAVLIHIAPWATDLELSATSAANILATVGGVSIIGRVVLGSVADRIGNRRVFAIGFIVMAAALLWLLPATEEWSLYLFAIVFGFAFGGNVTSQSPLVAGLFGLGSHGLILGVMGLGFSIGAAVGPLLAGYIFDVTNSYQVAFLVCAVISVTGLILALLIKPTPKADVSMAKSEFEQG